MRKIILLPMLLSALIFAGCSSQNAKTSDINKGGKGSVTETNGATSGTIGAGSGSTVTSSTTQDGSSNFDYLPGTNNDPNNTNDISLAGLNDQDNLLSQRIIYFDYDKSAIRPEYMVLINTHAKLLAKYPALKMRLEGHADERGSREYNVALSEARSQSVKSIMGLQGAQSGQMRTIGYGEEVPIVRGHSQESWQQNRRVEIKYDDY
jgi:peptidoglycan-associated lipoprotein